MKELAKEQGDRLKEIYAELKAIEDSLPIDDQAPMDAQIVQAYDRLISELEEMEGKSGGVTMKLPGIYEGSLFSYRVFPIDDRPILLQLQYQTQPFKASVKRLIAYLRTKYNLEEDKIVGIGNIIHIIQDEELKNRCIDLLSAKGNFDRVIREATTVLENRIRTLSDPSLREVGVDLVDKVLNPKRGMLILDGEPNEQEGFYQLYRGVMLSLRDETHHRILDRFTREDAIKTLAFIDILLETLKRCKRR